MTSQQQHQFYILTIVVIVVIFLIIIMGCCCIIAKKEHFTLSKPPSKKDDKPFRDTLVPPKNTLSFDCYRSLNHPGGPAAGTSLVSVESIKTGRDPIRIEQSFNWFNTQ